MQVIKSSEEFLEAVKNNRKDENGEHIDLINVEAYLEAKKNDSKAINALTKNMSTALIVAVHHGHHQMVRALLQSPLLNIHAANVWGWTALHYATNGENLCILKMLCYSDRVDEAFIRSKTPSNETALCLAKAALKNAKTPSNGDQTKVAKLSSIVEVLEETDGWLARKGAKARGANVKTGYTLSAIKPFNKISDGIFSHVWNRFLTDRDKKALWCAIGRFGLHKPVTVFYNNLEELLFRAVTTFNSPNFMDLEKIARLQPDLFFTPSEHIIEGLRGRQYDKATTPLKILFHAMDPRLGSILDTLRKQDPRYDTWIERHKREFLKYGIRTCVSGSPMRNEIFFNFSTIIDALHICKTRFSILEKNEEAVALLCNALRSLPAWVPSFLCNYAGYLYDLTSLQDVFIKTYGPCMALVEGGERRHWDVLFQADSEFCAIRWHKGYPSDMGFGGDDAELTLLTFDQCCAEGFEATLSSFKHLRDLFKDACDTFALQEGENVSMHLQRM